jgi:hypothetical protein
MGTKVASIFAEFGLDAKPLKKGLEDVQRDLDGAIGGDVAEQLHGAEHGFAAAAARTGR